LHGKNARDTITTHVISVGAHKKNKPTDVENVKQS